MPDDKRQSTGNQGQAMSSDRGDNRARSTSPEIALAKMITGIGGDAFADRVLAAVQSIADADMCSAFRVGDDGSLAFLLAAGVHPDIPGFSEFASLSYANRYWRRDMATRLALARQKIGQVHVVRQSWAGIADPEYRRDCYERAGVIERITIYGAGRPPVFLNAYRIASSGAFSMDGSALLETYAPILISAVERHDGLQRDGARAGLRPSLGEVTSRLMVIAKELSQREATVAGLLLLGMTQRDIAGRCGLSLNSVITYRRRAYQKLSVASRRDLISLYESRAAPG